MIHRKNFYKITLCTLFLALAFIMGRISSQVYLENACESGELSIELNAPYEVSIKKLGLGDHSFSNREYKIDEVPDELIGLDRLFFPGGVHNFFKFITDRPVRVYAVFNYNPNWCFPNDSRPEDFGWSLYKKEAYVGGSNPGKASIYYRDFFTGLVEFEVPKWWLCLGIKELNSNEREIVKLYENMNLPVRIISHAGSNTPEPNTLESIQNAIAAGAYGVEIDVQMTKDNVPILLHNTNMKGEAGVDLSCNDLSLNQIKRYKRKGLYEIPTLQQVLEFTRDKGILLMIDTTHIPANKSNKEVFEEIQNIILKCKAQGYAVIQINKNFQLSYINAREFKVAWNTFSNIPEDEKISFYTLNPIYEIGAKIVEKKIIEKIRQYSNDKEVISVCLSAKHYLAVLQAGCDYIMVDNIERFKQFCDENKINYWRREL